MRKILFITDTFINGRTFGSILKGQYAIDTVKYGETKEVGDYCAIICDVENDGEACLYEIGRVKKLTAFRDIPMLVCITKQNKVIARDAGEIGAAGSILKPFDPKTLAESLARATSPVGTKSDVNMKIVMPFVDGTVQVIETMTKEKTSRTSMFLKTNYSMFGDASGVMGITGETEGVVVVTFHRDLAFHLVAKMVGCGEDDLSVEDVNDGIGEIINMIAGSAKKTLSGTDFAFDISLPTVIMGHGHQIAHQRNVPVIVIVFDCNGKPFAIQLCVTSSDQNSPKEEHAENNKKNEQETVQV